MNKAAIKKFAVESRQKLIKSTIERLEELGITDKQVVELVELGGVYTVRAQTLTETEKKNRDIIIKKIQEKGYESFVEEVAYTWFNRIIAIRYMEVNDYLPFRTRVLSSEAQGKVDPDLITEIADHIEELELNRDKVIELKEQNKQEELFKYVFIKVCNYLGQFLPVMFEQIEDYTELLLPNVMIAKGSVIQDMTGLVPEEDWTNQVEIIGWLYQYYISEKKDQVFADLKKNKKITKENIPAATQLFTPKWIVKYMVENSLGRLWLEGHPNEELKSNWKYYLEEADQEEVVEIELVKIKKEREILTPEDLTIIDPAMGSGHILVYAFDVLYQIYKSEGYSEKEIPRLILEKNIHGLDIDERAGQLAYFAVMMKARQYDRRFLTREIAPQLFCPKGYDEGQELGSLLNVESLEPRPQEPEEFTHFNLNWEKDINAWNFRRLLSQKYDVVVTNPPYMGGSGMNAKLSDFVKKNFPDSKSDLFAVFIERCLQMTKTSTYTAMITQHAFMFLSSYEKLRRKLLHTDFINLAHLGARAFEEIGGEVVQTTSFVIRKSNIKDYKAIFARLVDYNSQQEKENAFLAKHDLYVTHKENFSKIPGSLIAYWVSENFINNFSNQKINDYFIPKFGMSTGDGDLYIRFWYESNLSDIAFNCNDENDYIEKDKTWNVLDKGGTYRRWYGNKNHIVLWKNNGTAIKNNPKSAVRSPQYFFRPHISWTLVSSGMFSARYFEKGYILDTASNCIYFNDNDTWLIALSLFNSKVTTLILELLNPTINISCGVVGLVPYIVDNIDIIKVSQLAEKNISISKIDWDSFETSWDFITHPLIKYKSCAGCADIPTEQWQYRIADAFRSWENNAESQFNTLKSNEEELNRIFINIYGLQDELNPEIEDKYVTVRKADINRDIKSFISYAVGCMMGRYSLDGEGLMYAGGEFDINKYQTFKADEDGIILISDTEYFKDDLLNRFVEFVKVVYGEETLEENLNFIADTECFKRKSTESARDCLRRYFLKGFMEDHLKVYQKRPIYWMFDSGKQNGFKALIYMHRYNEDMVAKVRTDYLHPLQRKYEAELERLNQLINFDNISASEKGKAKKRQEQIHKQLDECTQYDLLLAHVAHQRIPLDLDDGVKVNYQKFQNIELTTDGSSKAKKGDLLYKVKM